MLAKENPEIRWFPAAFWRPEEGRGARPALACTLCPFGCVLGDGDVGRCRVRRHRNAQLETATFATSVRHVQPIERKPFYHFRPGRPALTLAAPGCMFSCDYCQNARLSQYGREPDVDWSAVPVEPRAIVAEARTLGAVVALSYSEPTLAAELTLALAAEASSAGCPAVEIVWKTNGFICVEALEVVAPAIAAVNVDLKSADHDAHLRLTGAPLAPVVESLRRYAARGVWLEVSTPLIPGFNTDRASLRAMAEIVASISPDVPWHLLRFHPQYRYLVAAPTSPRQFEEAVTVAREVGLRHTYVERALGPNGRTTFCPSCGTTAVTREVGALRSLALKDGTCAACGKPMAGRW